MNLNCIVNNSMNYIISLIIAMINLLNNKYFITRFGTKVYKSTHQRWPKVCQHAANVYCIAIRIPHRGRKSPL